MEIKEHSKAHPFQETAKEYVLNMMRGSVKKGKHTLHHKNTGRCKDSQGLPVYADFDSLEEAMSCGVSIHPCKKCFPETE